MSHTPHRLCRGTVHLGLLLAAAALAGPGQAKDFEVLQKDKKFSQTKLTVNVGDTVNFKNVDPFAHNIFSLSDAKSFDLGAYLQGQSKKVVFDTPGTIEIECSIHPEMKMVIEVKK
jgi:plastocyanin